MNRYIFKILILLYFYFEFENIKLLNKYFGKSKDMYVFVYIF